MFNVNIYRKSTDGNLQVAKNFKAKEFSGGNELFLLNPKLPPYCQKIRDKFNRSWTPSSSYRTVEQNKKAGGASDSQHLYGNAVDIPASALGTTPSALYDFCNSIIGNNGGVGIYDWGVHIDVRGTRARWDYRTKK